MSFSFKGIFTSVFSKKKDLQITKSKLMNMFTPYFSNSVNPRLNDTFMSAVNTHAKHLSKIKPVVFLKDKKDKVWMTKVLSVKPNQITEAGAFWERVAKNYYLDNNAFIYLDWNLEKPRTPLRSMWILDPTDIQVKYSETDKEFYLNFNIQGVNITTGLDNIVHLARNVDNNEIFGKADNSINSVLSVINTNFEGIENAVKTSQFLRFVLTTTTLMDDDTKQKKAEEFANTYLAKDGTGIAYLDSSTILTQVNSNAKYANSAEMKFFENKIFNYLNINESILKADFSENQWQAYYETNIESLVNKLTNELNVKLFTTREYGTGNRVIVSSSELQVVSMTTRIAMVTNTKELGVFTINEYRKLFNMSPIEDGDKRLVSLNYINSEKADDYQMGKVVKNDEEK